METLGADRPYTCERAPRPLAPIRDHIYSLHALTRDHNLAAATVPAEVGDWLILAAGLDGVSIITNGLGPGDDMCSNIYEESRGPAAAAVATELTRLLFIWGALQGLMRVKWGRKREQGQPRLLAQLVDQQAPPLLHQECAARHLIESLRQHSHESEFRVALERAERFGGGIVGQSAFAAYQLRNSLAHGAVPWPDDNSIPSKPAVAIGSTACRVLTFAAQSMLLNIVPPECEVTNVVEDEWLEVPALDVLATAQLRGPAW